MILFKPGDVVLIPFPFTDFSTFKQRPALVISSPNFNRTHSDIMISAITSNISLRRTKKDEYVLSKSDQAAACLPKISAVKYGKIITIDQRLVRKTIGHLPIKTTRIILDNIRNIITF
jgi:mRNA interferase MazF